MRPRPGGRGETSGPRRRLDIARDGLQCGHDPEAVESERCSDSGIDGLRDFNAATTRRPWRAVQWMSTTYVHVGQLQCGHDPEAVESYGHGLLADTPCR